MKTVVLIYLIMAVGSIGLGILAGNSLVYGFNHLPDKWFKNPVAVTHGPDMPLGTQRIKSVPYKVLFSGVFTLVIMHMAIGSWQYTIGASIYLWLLAFIALGLYKYGDVVEELGILILIGAATFIMFREGWIYMLLGAAVGCAFSLIVLGVSRGIYKNKNFTFASVGLYTAIGLALGVVGIVPVIITSSFSGLIGKLIDKEGKRAGNILLHLVCWSMVYIAGGMKLQDYFMTIVEKII